MKFILNKIKTFNNYDKAMIIISFLGLIPFILGLLDLYYNKGNTYIKINIPRNDGIIDQINVIIFILSL